MRREADLPEPDAQALARRAFDDLRLAVMDWELIPWARQDPALGELRAEDGWAEVIPPSPGAP
jgi:hypothetical protein